MVFDQSATPENCAAIYRLKETSNLLNTQYVYSVGGMTSCQNQPENQAISILVLRESAQLA